MDGEIERMFIYLHVPHTIEDTSKVVCALSSIGEASIWCSLGSKTVNATRTPRNLGASHFLYNKREEKYKAVHGKREIPGLQQHHRESKDHRSLSKGTLA